MWVYIWTDKWLPWENTLAYFPMQWDNLDKVWTFTLDVSWTQQTIWRKFTSQTSLNTTPTWIKTMSWWVKIASATPSGWSSWQCWILASYWNYLCYFNSSSDVKAKSIYCYANNTNYYKNVNIIDNSWHHIAITNNWSTIVWYVDGVSYALWNPSLPWLSKLLVFCSWWNTIDVTLSEVILENKQWTQSEVSNYYNTTKSKYWIS